MKSHVCSKVIAKGKKTATIKANRDIIRSLLSFSAKNNKPIDWENVLSYPLSRISLCFSTADSNPQKTAKNKLQEVVLKKGDSTIVANPREVVAESRYNSTYLVGYEELTWKLLPSFPRKFQRVNIVADTYRNVSITAGERGSRERSDKVIIKLTKSKILKDFQAFLRDGENKNRLIDLLCETTSSSSDRTLVILQTSVICFSKEDSYVRLNASQVTTVDELSSNQDKADIKVILHSAHDFTAPLW